MPGTETDEAQSRCPGCGAEVAPPGRFCVRCGREVAEPAAAPEETDHAEPALRLVPSGTMPPPASGRGATLHCPSCGQVNARSRELCRACGLDLDPADRTSVAPRPGAPPPATSSRWRWLRHGWIVAAAVLLVAGAVTATLAWAEVGPFAPTEAPLAAVAFPADRYPEAPTPLELADIGTLTSAAPDGDRIFAPDRMVDADPGTAWRGEAGALPEGAHETIDVALARPAWVRELVVANGDHLDAAAYEASGRVQRLELWVDGDLYLQATLLDLGRQRQAVVLPEPLLTTAVRLVLVDTLDGIEHAEPAIAGLELRGYPADPEDAALAEDRAQRRPAIGVLVTERRPDTFARLRPDQGS
ncbi:MAG: NADase-type glycan-binding domain-containing protein [Nitriliruptoraceae bacterium]